MKTIEFIIVLLAGLNLPLTWFVLLPLHQPSTVLKWAVKVLICGLSPVFFLISILTLIAGGLINSLPAILISSLSALFYLIYIIQSSHSAEISAEFKKIFGMYWENKIAPARRRQMLKRRYVFVLPELKQPILTQNIPFYKFPDTSKHLLCDVWQPPKSVNRSGVAFIYLHGSAWTSLDKDFGTRLFFMHLANHGHVIMDVAYRLFPEADFNGMVHDTKHAIAWLKNNATTYGVDPEKIVLGGGSAGAHIALLAAYTDNRRQLTPDDLDDIDLSVRAVISFYGQSDLSATYYHTAQHLATHSALSTSSENKSGGMPSWIRKGMGDNFKRLGFDKKVEPGFLSPILGGNPDEKPEAYALFSPISHVNRDCPDTLLIHGEHDILAPLNAIQKLHASLVAAGVPVILQTIPKTDHAFDLVFPKISPSAHNAIYTVERFLAMIESDTDGPRVVREREHLAQRL